MTICARCFLQNHFVRWISTKRKVLSEFNMDIYKEIESDEVRWKRHPGVMRLGPTEVPETVQNAIKHITRDMAIKTVLKDGVAFTRYLEGRQPPAEENNLKQTIEKFAKNAKKKYNVSDSMVTDEQIKRVNNKVDEMLKTKVYNWKQIQYDSYLSMVYLVSRTAPEYATLCRVFNELAIRDKSFEPQSVFDFGSGVGTVSWAIKQYWEKSVKDYYCIDASPKMNDIAQALIQNGDCKGEPLKGVYYRQFLPSQHRLYDLVVCAYTLFELPSRKTRIETLVNLWNKTKKYLVIVEMGTNAGFRLVTEARDFILFSNTSNNPDSPISKATVFAPCSHELHCPRIGDKTPCNFEVNYKLLNLDGKDRMNKEKFSYVILKKGERNKDDQQWPRIVKPVIKRSGHAICRFCTAYGKLDEVIFSAAKHGKIPYLCARASKWGDLVPVVLNETEVAVDFESDDNEVADETRENYVESYTSVDNKDK